MAGVSKSKGSRRYLYIKVPVGIDRILLPILSPDTWKFILSNCLLCYDLAYNSNITLRNVTVNYFQTQALLFSPYHPIPSTPSLILNYDFLLVAVLT